MRACGVDEALVVPVRLDSRGVARARRGLGVLPALLRGLVRVSCVARAMVGGSLARRLAGVPRVSARVLCWSWCGLRSRRCWGMRPRSAVDTQRAFKDLGFDSLTAVELRNRLSAATGSASTGDTWCSTIRLRRRWRVSAG